MGSGGTITSTGTVRPDIDDAFWTIVTGDGQWVRTEFDAIIDAAWDGPTPPPSARPTTTAHPTALFGQATRQPAVGQPSGPAAAVPPRPAVTPGLGLKSGLSVWCRAVHPARHRFHRDRP